MESYLKHLDDFFCQTYTDYVRIRTIEGYKAPDLIVIGADGNISRKSESLLRICHQQDPDAILAQFKLGLEDLYFTFHFSPVPFFKRIGDAFKKNTFAKRLPEILARYHETVDSVGKKLSLDGKVWKGIAKGDLYPEKNTLLALALVCRMCAEDVNDMMLLRGYTLESNNVRDVVVGYLLQQKIFNEQMRDRCLAEYKIESLPILRVDEIA